MGRAGKSNLRKDSPPDIYSSPSDSRSRATTQNRTASGQRPTIRPSSADQTLAWGDSPVESAPIPVDPKGTMGDQAASNVAAIAGIPSVRPVDLAFNENANTLLLIGPSSSPSKPPAPPAAPRLNVHRGRRHQCMSTIGAAAPISNLIIEQPSLIQLSSMVLLAKRRAFPTA